MEKEQYGAGTGLNAGIPMAGAEHTGASPDSGGRQSGAPADGPAPRPAKPLDGGLRKGVHMDEEYTP